MPITNYEPVLSAADQLETAGRKMFSVYVLTLSDMEKRHHLEDVEISLQNALSLIRTVKRELL